MYGEQVCEEEFSYLLTSIYETSTVKLILGSAAFLSPTRLNNSEHVKGIIPLSAPSRAPSQHKCHNKMSILFNPHPIILDKFMVSVCGHILKSMELAYTTFQNLLLIVRT